VAPCRIGLRISRGVLTFLLYFTPLFCCEKGRRELASTSRVDGAKGPKCFDVQGDEDFDPDRSGPGRQSGSEQNDKKMCPVDRQVVSVGMMRLDELSRQPIFLDLSMMVKTFRRALLIQLVFSSHRVP
jgi:hypothetical protein